MSDVITKNARIVKRLVLQERDYEVGYDGITAIEPYDEYGQMTYVPWFNVWRGAELWCKVNGAFAQVVEYGQGYESQREVTPPASS